jgi:hypothetical protein
LSTGIIKSVSAITLIVAALLDSSAGYRIVLDLVVCVAALLVLAQAFRIRKYFWAVGFAVIAVLINPAVPLVLSHTRFLMLDLLCMGAFLISLSALRWPGITMAAPITGEWTGKESL